MVTIKINYDLYKKYLLAKAEKAANKQIREIKRQLLTTSSCKFIKPLI